MSRIKPTNITTTQFHPCYYTPLLPLLLPLLTLLELKFAVLPGTVTAHVLLYIGVFVVVDTDTLVTRSLG